MRGRMPRALRLPKFLYAKQLKSLISSGTQYINTGFVPTANTRFLVSFRLASPGTANEAIVSTGSFSFRYIGANGYFRSNSGNQANFPTTIDASAYHVAEKRMLGCTIDDTWSVTNTASTPANPLFLFAHNNAGTAQNHATVEIGYVKIYESDTLVRDYIPVLDSEGTACMFDRVAQECVYNAGSGSFGYGEVL